MNVNPDHWTALFCVWTTLALLVLLVVGLWWRVRLGRDYSQFWPVSGGVLAAYFAGIGWSVGDLMPVWVWLGAGAVAFAWAYVWSQSFPRYLAALREAVPRRQVDDDER